MTDADAMLDKLWTQDEAPERDAVFRLGVMDGLARRRLRLDLFTYGALATGLGAAAWALAPVVDDLGGVLGGGLALAAVAAVGVGLSLLAPLSATISRT